MPRVGKEVAAFWWIGQRLVVKLKNGIVWEYPFAKLVNVETDGLDVDGDIKVFRDTAIAYEPREY